MKKKPNIATELYKAQSAGRLRVLRRMRQALANDYIRLLAFGEEMKSRFDGVCAEIKQEESQWKDDK